MGIWYIGLFRLGVISIEALPIKHSFGYNLFGAFYFI
jgi:hypothetical protein